MHFVEKEPIQKRKDFTKKLKSGELDKLNIKVKKSKIKKNFKKGIF